MQTEVWVCGRRDPVLRRCVYYRQNLNDFEGFMQDLEEDPELRSTINIYRDPAYTQGAV